MDMDYECSKDQMENIVMRVPFKGDEAARFRAFLSSTGRKAGPFVRTLILSSINPASACLNTKEEQTDGGQE